MCGCFASGSIEGSTRENAPPAEGVQASAEAAAEVAASLLADNIRHCLAELDMLYADLPVLTITCVAKDGSGNVIFATTVARQL